VAPDGVDGKIIEAGIDYSGSVTADSVVAGMEESVDQVTDGDSTQVPAGDTDEAREWLAEQYADGVGNFFF